MSPDNYLADLSSHVQVARYQAASDSTGTQYPGLGIEWVRENSTSITQYVTEDLSSEMDPTQILYHTDYKIVSGNGNTAYADSPGMVEVAVDGTKVLVGSVDGADKEIVLAGSPAPGSTSMSVSYWKRTLVSPGIFRIEFTEDNQFIIYPIYTVGGEVLFGETTGHETTAQLLMDPIVSGAGPTALYPNTDQLLLYHINATPSDFPIELARGTDYSVTSGGLITFLKPVEPRFRMVADYRYSHHGLALGPFTFSEYQEVHYALPGVVLCMGRRAKKGDRQVVRVSEFRELQAKIYGGHWEMSMNLALISKDSRQIEEMTDQVINWLWAVRKNQLEYEGISLTRVEPSGESEESFTDNVTDFYYESTVDISLMTEWQRFVPHLYRIEHFSIDEETYVVDTRPVYKFPTVGFERET